MDIVGYSSCDGCPGGNIEYVVDEMKSNGAEIIHLATGLIVGYPPCPHITYFHDFIKTRHGLEVVYGTHPIPEKYKKTHETIGTWDNDQWQAIIKPTMDHKKIRLAYN